MDQMVYLVFCAGAEEVFFLDALRGVQCGRQELCSCGLVTIITVVTDAFQPRSWKVSAHCGNAIGMVVYNGERAQINVIGFTGDRKCNKCYQGSP